ncbi:STAS domain-containing protein [Umezawaea sp. Da 62-37]|uniref:STAS domain-containing protein n=1 Tax=Umezawaea sp. Da 62-37 TaxID=3075927 RepID=UPI0028F7106C|nr:STAS domain-containing protein [Umezawaea sp. Da 62-37]WNV87557.1 STAS domain-containing protein [Umezawaea sp. Da 62-37]
MNVWTRVATLSDRRAVVVWMWGEVDHVTIDSFRWAVDQGFIAAAASRPTRPTPGTPMPVPVEVLVLDLTGIRFFGSLGLMALLQTRERATENGLRLVVAVPDRHLIRGITRMTEVDHDVELAESVDQALAAPSYGRHSKSGPG